MSQTERAGHPSSEAYDTICDSEFRDRFYFCCVMECKGAEKEQASDCHRNW